MNRFMLMGRLCAVVFALLFMVQSAAAADSPAMTRVGEHVVVFHGPVNAGILISGSKAWVIDCGDGSVAETLLSLGVSTVEKLLFTHHHRDQACGAGAFIEGGAKIAVPAPERDWFDHIERFWNDPRQRWHNYEVRPSRLMLTEPIKVDETLDAGQVLTFGPVRVEVLPTPGHTHGSISLLVESDGKRVVFSGDAICDDGQVWDVYTLQDAYKRGDRQIYGYHGFMGAWWTLADSLDRIKAARPDMLVPSHGRIMPDPARAIDLLKERLSTCYDRYVAISALRHYFPELFIDYEGRPGQMPLRPGKAPPEFLRHFDTSWVIVSEDKAAFVMDCRNEAVIKNIRDMVGRGELRKVEGLWVTHYHDDHVDAIPEFLREFGCPCFADRSVADVVSRPMAWGLPCMSPSVIHVDRPTADGESWQWHEFKMTAYYLPGQTLYHGALFVEGRGVRMLFVGDSFTRAGIDDYCTYNRNFLGDNVGFDRCLRLIEKLKPTHLFNCHVDQAFDFAAEGIAFMRATLAERERLFGQLVPWDHANFGLDAHWVRCDPYEQSVSPGGTLELRVVITNHAGELRQAACRLAPPPSWNMSSIPAKAELAATVAPASSQQEPLPWREIKVPAKSEGVIPLSLRIPPHVTAGRHTIAVDVRFGSRTLPQFGTAIVELTPSTAGK